MLCVAHKGRCVSGAFGHASFYAPESGSVIAVTFTWVSGQIYHCGVNAPPCLGRWGSTNNNPNALNFHVTRSNNNVLLPLSSGTVGYGSLAGITSPYGFYTIAGQTYNGNTLEIMGPSFSVAQHEELRVYYGEVYPGTANSGGDNGGSTCFDMRLCYDAGLSVLLFFVFTR